MKFLSICMVLLPSLAAAFPQMASNMDEETLRKYAAVKKRDIPVSARTDPLSSLISDISGLIGSVAKGALDPSNKRPEPGYDFKAPGPNDSRGPCPALNLLANHGYLPRNGYVNYGQVVEAVARGFNMATDLAVVLATFATLTDGDIVTQSWYLGTDPTTKIGGLNRHSTVEADVSPNKEDYYNGCGDNHHISSRLFKQHVKFLLTSKSKTFDLDVMGSQYAANAAFSKKNNPYIYYFPFPSIVSVVAYNFYPRFFSNGTFLAGGVPNYESISSIIGAKFDWKTGEFEYVPERFPNNWYRRATPFGAVEALVEGFTTIYPRNPIGMPFGQLGTANLNPATILCDLYQGINSIAPLAVAGSAEQVAAAISWALGNIEPLFEGTIAGCAASSLSQNFLYPNSKQTGGPLAPPPSVIKNTGNNVYNKVYFKTAPTTPQCNHVYNP